MPDLDLAACRRWVALGLARLQALASTIDGLNVFPVPDGDTGTNVLLTFRRAAKEADSDEADSAVDLAQLTAALARGALLGARGNSGIITAAFLQGCADGFEQCRNEDPEGVLPVVTGEQFSSALTQADAHAWQAVATPVEGTILTVSRAAAEAAAASLPGDAAGVITAATDAARVALAETPAQLPALTGVVDAGGAAFVVLLDALRAAITDQPIATLPGVDDATGLPTQHLVRASGPEYEVMFELVAAEGVSVSALQDSLGECGDSVAVVSSAQGWHAHVHTDDPAEALQRGAGFGDLSSPQVVHLASGTPRPVPSTGVGCVAWVSGTGLASLLAQLGIVAVLGDEASRVSTEQVVAAAHATGAHELLLLPNDRDSMAMMHAARGLCLEHGLTAEVVPSMAEPAGVAAASVFDPSASLADNLHSMTEAASGVRCFTIATATRSVETPVGACRAGQVVGIEDGAIIAVSDDVTGALTSVVDGLNAHPERVTVLVGAGVAAGTIETLGALLPHAEVHEIDAGHGAVGLQVGFE